jgi:hypothetical protein
MRWIEDLFASIDEMDAEKFGEYVRQFFGMFKRLRHQLIGSWSHPDAIFIQGEVTYVKPDGSELTLPFLNCFKMRGDKIHEYLIYIDPTPLMG